jgi:PAS domain S-box-containing protein
MENNTSNDQQPLAGQLPSSEDFRMAHLAAIVDSSDDAIISKTLDGTITSWNIGAQRIFGYTAAEAVGKPITMLIPLDRLEEEPAIVDRLKRGERMDHFETKRVTRDGRLLDISLTISPVKGSNGIIIGASKIARDITAQKHAERMIAEQQENFRIELERKVEERTAELKKSNDELEQYAYIASHDLQEPLRKIQNFTELMNDSLHDPELVQRYRQKIIATAERMSIFIQDVLNYSRLAQVDTEFELVDLNEVLRHIFTDFELLIAEKHATITADPLPQVRGDAQQLRQLFGNLLSNALKFSERVPAISITVDTNYANPGKDASGPPAPMFSIVFRDNGIGFEQEFASQLFKAFKRLNNRQLYSGSGIGLALCKRIVERHGGTITVASQPGVGTAFTILLPKG